MPSLSARANLLAARGDWMGALADLDMALTNRPDDPHLRLRRADLLLRQGDWLRGLADHEARLDLPGERYAPDLPRWQGEPLDGRLLIYPEQADIEGDAAIRDTLMLARGVDAVVQCAAELADWLGMPTIRREAPIEGFAAAAPLRSLPFLLGWTLESLPPADPARSGAEPSGRIGWFARSEPPIGAAVERDPAQIASCGLVIGDDIPATHKAARLGIPTILLMGRSADWLWGPRRTVALVSDARSAARGRGRKAGGATRGVLGRLGRHAAEAQHGQSRGTIPPIAATQGIAARRRRSPAPR